MLTYDLRVHTDSLNALLRLGEVNRTLGRLEAARDYYKRFLGDPAERRRLIRQRLAEVEQAIERAKK